MNLSVVHDQNRSAMKIRMLKCRIRIYQINDELGVESTQAGTLSEHYLLNLLLRDSKHSRHMLLALSVRMMAPSCTCWCIVEAIVCIPRTGCLLVGNKLRFERKG